MVNHFIELLAVPVCRCTVQQEKYMKDGMRKSEEKEEWNGKNNEKHVREKKIVENSTGKVENDFNTVGLVSVTKLCVYKKVRHLKC